VIFPEEFPKLIIRYRCNIVVTYVSIGGVLTNDRLLWKNGVIEKKEYWRVASYALVKLPRVGGLLACSSFAEAESDLET
jgi:hypothetical protein